MKIAHLGIVVRSIDKALPLWKIALKGEVSYRKKYERENAEIAMLKVGNVNIELLEPIGECVLKRFLETNERIPDSGFGIGGKPNAERNK